MCVQWRGCCSLPHLESEVVEEVQALLQLLAKRADRGAVRLDALLLLLRHVELAAKDLPDGFLAAAAAAAASSLTLVVLALRLLVKVVVLCSYECVRCVVLSRRLALAATRSRV